MTEPVTILAGVPTPFRVAFSTRVGGVSSGAYAALNLGLATDDSEDAVLENRTRLLASLGADASRASMCRQVHGSTVTRADAAGIDRPHAHPERDGVWTDRPLEPVMVLSADCVPVALCRRGKQPAVAAVHAGWRGLLAGVLESGLGALGSTDVVATIGPSIGRCCYEVSDELAAQFSRRYGKGVVEGRHIDLPLSAQTALRQAGVREIETLDLCTACDERRFFSHRRDDGVTGRQGVVALIEAEPGR